MCQILISLFWFSSCYFIHTSTDVIGTTHEIKNDSVWVKPSEFGLLKLMWALLLTSLEMRNCSLIISGKPLLSFVGFNHTACYYLDWDRRNRIFHIFFKYFSYFSTVSCILSQKLVLGFYKLMCTFRINFLIQNSCSNLGEK